MSNKKIDILEDGQGLSIKINWFSGKAYFMLPMALIWNGAIFFFIKNLWLTPGTPLMVKFFPIFHLFVGLFLIYYVSSLFLNNTYVDVDDRYLRVHNDPLPWWRSKKEIPLNEIKQLYVKENKKSSENGPKYSYELRAKMNSGEDQKILKVESLNSADLFALEEKIENYLGIIDTPVKGEFGSKVYNLDLEKLKLANNPLHQKIKLQSRLDANDNSSS